MRQALAISPKAALITLPETSKQLGQAYQEFLDARAVAIHKAFVCGCLLNEAKELCGHGNFLKWLADEHPEISERTAREHMEVARRVLESQSLPTRLLPENADLGKDMPIWEALALPITALPPAAVEARQLLLAFMEDKTIADVMGRSVVGGEPAHNITRAANGKTKGGSNGEDRKDWPKFIGEHLSDLSAHLKHWKSFTGAMVEVVEAKFKAAIAKWPTPLLEMVARLVKEEMKSR